MTPDSTETALPEIRVPARLTLAGLAGGLLIGLLLRETPLLAPAMTVTKPVGMLWLRALQMTIIPLVAGLLFTGIVQTAEAARAGMMARRTLGLFAAVLLAGAIMATLLMPALLDLIPVPGGAAEALRGDSTEGGPVPNLADFTASLLPANIVDAVASDAMLPLVAFIALFAFASTRLTEGPRRQLALLFRAIAGAMMVVVGWVMALAPIGVFALALGVATQSGMTALGTLAHYIVLVSAIGALVLLAAYMIATFGGRQSLRAFSRAVAPAQAVALSTQSSLASLPPMLAACRQLGLRETSADFVLPLAVAIFRATSPAMNLAVAIYAARITGTDLPPAALAVGVGVAFLISLSTVSLPGTISFVASIGPIAIAMGVPLAPLALLVAVEMLPDIVRTVANVTMNVAVTTVVDRGSADPDTTSG